MDGCTWRLSRRPRRQKPTLWLPESMPCCRACESPRSCTKLAATFTNLRTGERCDSENALLAAILADATNLGLTRMAAASQGVTRDQLIWTADAYIRPETYK